MSPEKQYHKAEDFPATSWQRQAVERGTHRFEVAPSPDVHALQALDSPGET